MAPSEVADFARRLYKKGADDDVLFLAGGVAFSILLAGVPFFLLLASWLGYALGSSDEEASGAVAGFIIDFFPAATPGKGSFVDPVIRDIVRTRGAAGLLGAVAFIWFSTRLFTGLRSVLDKAFDVPKRHGIFFGKLFDVWLTLAATALVIAWIGGSAYIVLARTRGVEFLAGMGLGNDGILGTLTYVIGRIATFGLLTTIFFALYKVVPNRRVRWQQALFGAVTASLLFELARIVFAWIITRWDPASFYTGTLAAIIVVVFWVYYGALIVIMGGSASQVHERMRLARLEKK